MFYSLKKKKRDEKSFRVPRPGNATEFPVIYFAGAFRETQKKNNFPGNYFPFDNFAE